MAAEQQELFGRGAVVVLAEYRRQRSGDRVTQPEVPDWAPRPRRLLSEGAILHRQRMLRHLGEAANQR